MPLSEHEQRLLEQMERALYAEDPKFATALRQPSGTRVSRKRLILGVVVMLVGLGLLVTGVAVKLAIVGVLGFLAMLAGVVLAFTGSAETVTTTTADTTHPATPTAKPQAGFMGKMEDRWRNRREGDQN